MWNKKRIVWFVLMFITMAVIFCFSSQSTAKSNDLSVAVGEVVSITPQHEWQDPGTTPILLGLNIRKLAHVGLYAILGITVYGVVYKWYWVVLICYGYAISDEVHQLLIGRNASVRATLLDAVGFCSAIFLCVIMSSLIKLLKHKRCK